MSGVRVGNELNNLLVIIEYFSSCSQIEDFWFCFSLFWWFWRWEQFDGFTLDEWHLWLSNLLEEEEVVIEVSDR